MKSIRTKILALTLILLVGSVSISAAISVYTTYNSTMYALEQSVSSTIDAVSEAVSARLDCCKTMAAQHASSPIIVNGVSDTEKYRDEISVELEKFLSDGDYLKVSLVDKNGTDFSTGYDVSKQAFFSKVSSTKEPCVSDPVTNPLTNSQELFVAAPIMIDGSFNGCIIHSIDPSLLSNILAEIHIGEGGRVGIINADGDVVAHTDATLVHSETNFIAGAKEDSSLAEIAKLHAKLIANESGFESYNHENINKFMAFMPMPKETDWGIYLSVNQAEFLSMMKTAILVGLVIMLVIIAVAVLLILNLTSKIVKPIKKCADRLVLLANGDLTSPVLTVDTNDETEVLVNSTEKIVSRTRAIISDVTNGVNLMADGNYNQTPKHPEMFIGDYAELSDAMFKVMDKMSVTLSQIDNSSNLINAGAEQLSSDINALAGSSSEQSSAVTELVVSIDNITESIKSTSNNCQSAKEANRSALIAFSKFNRQMGTMINAMEGISEKSNEISQIIKTIDDIAFQTNILSLNAAVEAARAGEAGLGFAVVAEEVRVLAEKSAEAARDTADLIEDTIAVMNMGTRATSGASSSAEVVLANAKKIGDLVESIAEDSAKQSIEADQIGVETDKISSSIQINSSSAQEGAAISEEFLKQANSLQELVEKFDYKATQIIGEEDESDYDDYSFSEY